MNDVSDYFAATVELPLNIKPMAKKPRYPGAYSSDEPSPYEKSALSNSEVAQEAKENPDGFYNQRDPHYPIQHERPEHRWIISLKATGMSNKEVAEATGFTPVAVSNVLRQPWATKRLAEMMATQGKNAVREVLKASALDSIMTQLEIRDNPEVPPAVRLSAADKLLDRLFGKPNQPIQHTVVNDVDKLSDEELGKLITGEGGGGTN